MSAPRMIIRADGRREPMPAECVGSIRLLSALIGADLVDTVRLRHLGRPVIVMFVDDLGHQRLRPVNDAATQLYRANCVPGTTHVIRGDVVICPDGTSHEPRRDRPGGPGGGHAGRRVAAV